MLTALRGVLRVASSSDARFRSARFRYTPGERQQKPIMTPVDGVHHAAIYHVTEDTGRRDEKNLSPKLVPGTNPHPNAPPKADQNERNIGELPNPSVLA